MKKYIILDDDYVITNDIYINSDDCKEILKNRCKEILKMDMYDPSIKI